MSITSAWQSRSRAERRNITRGAVVVVVVLIVTFAWLPLERERNRLAARMPAVRASIDALQRDADEVRRLRSLPEVGASSASPLAALATNGGGLPGATLTILDNRRMRVSGSDLGFGALLEWLGNARQTHGMGVESARIEALPTSGRVRAQLVLARP